MARAAALAALTLACASSALAAPYVRSPPSGDLPLHALPAAAAGLPEQVHLMTAGPSHVAVMWVTSGPAKAVARWGASAAEVTAGGTTSEGNTTRYSCLGEPCGGHYKSGELHSALVGPLEPGQAVFYAVGPPEASSQVFSFTAPPAAELQPTPTTFAMVGDLGQTADSNATLQHVKAAVAGGARLVVHAGDLSYADCYQPRWDSYGRLAEQAAARVPWQTVVGNHEVERPLWCGLLLNRSFAAYVKRYRTPHAESGSPDPLYYSFEAAGVHWLMLASYTDFAAGSPQYLWLQSDLEAVDRQKTPWLVAVLHAPWYNSNSAHQHEAEEDQMREALEPLLYSHGADAVFAGHVHAYERSSRVYKSEADRCAPVYLNIGDGGNREGLARTYLDPQPAWSAFREASFGHGLLTVRNATHARFSWHRDQDGELQEGDHTWLVKDPSCKSRAARRKEGASL